MILRPNFPAGISNFHDLIFYNDDGSSFSAYFEWSVRDVFLNFRSTLSS